MIPSTSTMATPSPPTPLTPPTPPTAADVDVSPTNIGILAMEVYFPSLFVDQEDLEGHSCEAKGKYTIGLGQVSKNRIKSYQSKA